MEPQNFESLNQEPLNDKSYSIEHEESSPSFASAQYYNSGCREQLKDPWTLGYLGIAAAGIATQFAFGNPSYREMALVPFASILTTIYEHWLNENADLERIGLNNKILRKFTIYAMALAPVDIIPFIATALPNSLPGWSSNADGIFLSYHIMVFGFLLVNYISNKLNNPRQGKMSKQEPFKEG